MYFWIAYRVENTAMILEQVVAVTEKYDINSKFMVRFDMIDEGGASLIAPYV